MKIGSAHDHGKVLLVIQIKSNEAKRYNLILIPGTADVIRKIVKSKLLSNHVV